MDWTPVIWSSIVWAFVAVYAYMLGKLNTEAKYTRFEQQRLLRQVNPVQTRRRHHTDKVARPAADITVIDGVYSVVGSERNHSVVAH